MPPEHVYVLGDHRAGSMDSRHYGPVPLENVAGRAVYVFWVQEGWDRFGAIR